MLRLSASTLHLCAQPVAAAVGNVIPQRIAEASFQASTLRIDGKLEVDSALHVAANSATLGTVRADTLDISCVELVADKLEGSDVRIAGRAQIKKLQARTASCHTIELDSGYCSELAVDGSASIHTFHGHLCGTFETLDVEHLTGSIDASVVSAVVRFDAQHSRPSNIHARDRLEVVLCTDDDVDLVLEAPDISHDGQLEIVEDDVRDGLRRVTARHRAAKATTANHRGAGKIDVAGAALQRWDSAVHSAADHDRGIRRLELRVAAGPLILPKPASWIDTIRAAVDARR